MLGEMSENEVPTSVNLGLNKIKVAPYGPQLGQHEALSLKIIFQTSMDPETTEKKDENKCESHVLPACSCSRRCLESHAGVMQPQAAPSAPAPFPTTKEKEV